MRWTQVVEKVQQGGTDSIFTIPMLVSLDESVYIRSD